MLFHKDRRVIRPSSGRTQETFDTYGHNPPQDDAFFDPTNPPVPHEDVDTDDLRKWMNQWRHGSYRR